MPKYHISPESGRPNICRAELRSCPVGGADEHYSSKEEANAARETRLSEEFSSGLKGAKRGDPEGHTLQRPPKKSDLVAIKNPDFGKSYLADRYMRGRIERLTTRGGVKLAIVAVDSSGPLVTVPADSVLVRKPASGALRYIDRDSRVFVGPQDIDTSDFDEVDFEMIDHASRGLSNPLSWDKVDDLGVTREEHVARWEAFRKENGFKLLSEE